MPDGMIQQMKHDPSMLYLVGSSLAVRELWGGEPFWGPYRLRFEAALAGKTGRWLDYYLGLRRHLYDGYQRVSETDCLIVFDLRSRAEAARPAPAVDEAAFVEVGA